jgi:hypothetical protein
VCNVSPAPDDVDVDDVAAADAVDDAVEANDSETGIDCVEADDDDCAAAKPTRADTMKDFEKYMFTWVLLIGVGLMNY